MDVATYLMLATAVFGASALQAATGIGYGVIAGPVFLVAMNGAEAFQLSTLHNLLIAVLLAPLLISHVRWGTLKPLLLGSFLGIAAGLLLQQVIHVGLLKLVSAAMVGFVAITLLRGLRGDRAQRHEAENAFEAGSVGILAGLMGGMLAMPGPLAATWMAIRGYSKREIRSTILSFFIAAYGVNAVFYAVFTGFSGDILWQSVLLSPPLLVGIAVGSIATRWLSEQLFRQVLLTVLVLTLLLLLYSLIAG